MLSAGLVQYTNPVSLHLQNELQPAEILHSIWKQTTGCLEAWETPQCLKMSDWCPSTITLIFIAVFVGDFDNRCC